ncbi:MAG: hypothetical protein RBT74_10855 [Tenuifilaceae bacterium]|jgi:hypothetical protein|nr:hypothetical protein [Tenuifilaceae bacterium]
MSAEKYTLGLKWVKFGTPTGTATMPATLTDFAKTVKGSMTVDESESTIKDFNVEEVDAPVRQAITENGKLTLVWKAYNLDPEIIAAVKGGTSTATKFSAPAKSVIIEKALEVKSIDNVVFAIPKASIVARVTGQIGTDDMLQLEVKATAIDPGDGGSPWFIEHGVADPT